MSGVFKRNLLQLVLTVVMLATSGLYLYGVPNLYGPSNLFAGELPTVKQSLFFLFETLIILAAWVFYVRSWKENFKPAADAEQPVEGSAALCGPITPTKK